jgi:alkanesulfonate monooxygenase SsuD/methylene tetrahydromethanopterin reductase-like flavin-dependent oxidoreductase (luciferase family)
MSLDDISGGRCVLGVGAGSQGSDASVLGNPVWSAAERTDRLEEFVEMLDRLLRHREVTFSGRYWSAVEARADPGCVQQPRLPFAIAATGPRSLRVAARHASTWVTNGDRSHTGPPLGPEQGARVVTRQTKLLEEACEKEGRDPASVDRLVLTGSRLDSGLSSPEAFNAVKEAYASVGVTDLVVHWPRPADPYAGDEAILEHIVG